MLVGGNGPTVLDRAAAFGDAWFPNFARGSVLERIPEARERGIPVLVMGVPADAEGARAAARGGRAAGRPLAAVGRPLAWSSAELERFEAAVAELNGE